MRVGLDPGQERHAAFEPGVDQDEVGVLAAQGRERLARAGAVVQLAPPVAQAGADDLERLAGPLRDDETSG